jgi:ribose/xylose/arabinose/galactoside ABC-type transport system permease subunit
VTVVGYALAGLFAAVSGIALVLYSGGISGTDQSLHLLLLAVAGAFLGRAFTSNGSFSVASSFVAGLILAGIENGLISAGISNEVSPVVEGAILFAAIAGATLAVRGRPRYVIGQEKVL